MNNEKITDSQKLSLISALVSYAFESVSDNCEQDKYYLLGLFAAIDRIIRTEEEQ